MREQPDEFGPAGADEDEERPVPLGRPQPIAWPRPPGGSAARPGTSGQDHDPAGTPPGSPSSHPDGSIMTPSSISRGGSAAGTLQGGTTVPSTPGPTATAGTDTRQDDASRDTPATHPGRTSPRLADRAPVDWSSGGSGWSSTPAPPVGSAPGTVPRPGSERDPGPPSGRLVPVHPAAPSPAVRPGTRPTEQGEPRRRLAAGDFTPERMLPASRQVPTRGWQRTVNMLSGGLVNPGLSADEREERALVAQAKTPIKGYRNVAVLGLKGGSGKTTTTTMLGHTFASHRGDRVVAVDAAPDAGTLGYRVRRESAMSVRDLLAGAGRIERYADVRAYSSQANSRLEVIASDTDAEMSSTFNAEHYRTVARVLARFYSLVITDCGPGVLQEAMPPVLGIADQIVVVTSPAVDGGRSGSLTLDWLDAHGYHEHVTQAVVVINTVHHASPVDMRIFEEHFRQRCRAVVRIPFDPHLVQGAETDLEQVRPATRRAYLELAAAVADCFSGPGTGKPI